MNDGSSGRDDTQLLLRPDARLFGRYTLIACVGEGGMGVVWRACDEKLEREVALKFLPERVRRDPEAIRDLKRETRRCLELTHPNIVRVYDLIEDRLVAAIAMEFVPGQSLSALKAARPGGCFDAGDLIPLLPQLTAALDYAHAQAKVVHRDLKPANILVTAEGALKVADFGIARSLRETDTRQTADQRGASGTLAFMGPEQLLNRRSHPTDDIYALGATLYDLLTGKPPFYAGDLITQIRTVPPEPLAARRDDLGNAGAAIPPGWEATILACLAKRAEDRPRSASEVLFRLGLATRPAPVAGPPLAERTVVLPVPSGPLGNPVQPRAGAVPPTGPTPSAAGAAPPPQASARRNRWLPYLAAVAAAGAVLAVVFWPRGGRTPPVATVAPAVTAPVTEQPTATPSPVPRPVPATKQEKPAPPAPVAVQPREFVVTVDPADAGARLQLGPSAEFLVPGDGRAVVKDLPDGEHALIVRAAGYQPLSMRVMVKEGRGRAEVKLVANTGRLTLRVEPRGFQLAVNGREVRPEEISQGGLTLPAGEPLKVELSARGHKSAMRTLTLAPGAEQILTMVLEKQRGPVAGQPWENSLGMKFTRVPGVEVLFGVWETRVQDFEVFVRETRRTWTRPEFPQGPNHPAVMVSTDDARQFCAWLTQRERAAGQLGPDQEYRLPTDTEWDVAVGPGKQPWGSQWPPPKEAGNYAKSLNVDGHEFTAPVGTFAPNAHGLYDLGGNVWERVTDRSGGIRGAAFNGAARASLASSFRGGLADRDGSVGFRVVCVVGAAR